LSRLPRFGSTARSRRVDATPVAEGRQDGGPGMSKQIVRHAPSLRRYARALTGSQSSGDALVQNALEGLLGGSLRLEAELPLRVGLYRVLHQVWDWDGDRDAADSVADARLQGLSPRRRAALLLAGVEGFPAGEAAQVLEIDVATFTSTLADAERDLDQQLASRVLIIEDEPIIALDLTRLVRELGHDVVGAAATRAEAVSLAKSELPGLVLADIRLADGSNGIDAANDILAEMDVPVIFITAFPEHLLTGERPEPAFLITKPFREEAVKALVAQALFFHTPSRKAEGIQVAL
jgi:DNA-directed RNA polymerase specialized sigma24 family protein